MTYLLLFGPAVLLVAIALGLATTAWEPSPPRRFATIASGLLLIAVLAFLPLRKPAGRSLGMFLYLGLPVTAILYFSQSALARKSPWLVVIVVPLLWVLGLFTGCLVTENIGLISP